MCYYYYYCSYTRELSCYFDKMCSVCLSYYLLGKIRVDDDGRRDVGTRELAELRSDTTELGGWHDCKNRRVMCGGMLDDDALRKALHN